MPADDARLHPHLFDPNAATSSPFRSPLSGSRGFSLAPRNRAQHAGYLRGRLEEAAETSEARVQAQKDEGVEGGYGITLQFVGEPNFDLKFESLDMARSGIELLSVHTKPNGLVEATVFVPDGKLDLFLKRVTAYQDEQTKPNKKGETRPKNEDLVASISDIRVAALEALWTDTVPFPALDQDQTWEVWLRRSGGIDHLARLRALPPESGLRISGEAIEFIDRTVVLVHGKGNDLARSNDLLGAIAELRLAKTTADLFMDMTAVEQLPEALPGPVALDALAAIDDGGDLGQGSAGAMAVECDQCIAQPQSLSGPTCGRHVGR